MPFVHSRDAEFQPHVNGKRERPAWNLSLQWAPNDTSEYTFEAFYNGFRNDQHNGLFFTFVDWWGAVDPADPVEIYPDTNVVKSRYVNFPYQFISSDNTSAKTDSYLYALGGRWDLSDNFTLRSEIAYQDSKFEDKFFALRMDKVSPRLFIDFNTGSGVPYVEFFDDPNTPQDESDLADASQWNLAQLYDNGSKDSGDAFTWTADATMRRMGPGQQPRASAFARTTEVRRKTVTPVATSTATTHQVALAHPVLRLPRPDGRDHESLRWQGSGADVLGGLRRNKD